MKLEHVVSCPGLELDDFAALPITAQLRGPGLHQALKKNLNNVFKIGRPHYRVG